MTGRTLSQNSSKQEKATTITIATYFQGHSDVGRIKTKEVVVVSFDPADFGL